MCVEDENFSDVEGDPFQAVSDKAKHTAVLWNHRRVKAVTDVLKELHNFHNAEIHDAEFEGFLQHFSNCLPVEDQATWAKLAPKLTTDVMESLDPALTTYNRVRPHPNPNPNPSL